MIAKTKTWMVILLLKKLDQEKVAAPCLYAEISAF